MKVTKTEREVRYNLELTEIEASFLCHVMARIGGGPDTSRRYLADRFYNELKDLYSENDKMSGYIVCEDEV